MESAEFDAELDEVWDVWSRFTLTQKREFLRMFPSSEIEEKPHIVEFVP